MTIFETGPDIYSMEHYKQPHHYGCLYYSFVAFTGETSLLKHEKDCDVARFSIRIFRKGYRFEPVYVHPSKTTDLAFWTEWRKDRIAWDAWFPLSLSIDSLRYKDTRHRVAVGIHLNADVVRIADPGADAMIETDWEGFLDSPYSAAYDIGLLQPALLKYYEPYRGDRVRLEPLDA